MFIYLFRMHEVAFAKGKICLGNLYPFCRHPLARMPHSQKHLSRSVSAQKRAGTCQYQDYWLPFYHLHYAGGQFT